MVADRARTLRLLSFGLVGVAALLAVIACASFQHRQGGVSLLHMGALTRQMDEQAAARVEGRYASDYAPLHHAMFHDTEPSKPLSHGVVSTSLLPQRTSHKAAAKTNHETERPDDMWHRAKHGEDARKFRNEIDSAAATSRRLSDRDAGIEESADEGADSLLKSYDDAVNSGVDDYDRMSKAIDEKAKRAFLHLPESKRSSAPAPHPRRVKRLQTAEARPVPSAAAAGDPLTEQKSTWEKLGIHGPLLGVPSEYKHEKDVTGGARKAVGDLPWYVTQAHKDLEEAEYVRQRQMPRAHTALAQKRRLDGIEREAKAPLLKVKKGTSLQQVVSNAVSAALHRDPQYSQLRSQQPVMRFKLSYNSGDTSAQPPARLRSSPASAGGRKQQLVQEQDERDPVTRMPDPAKTVNALELPTQSAHDVASSMFHMEMKHLDNQMDAIYGRAPSQREEAEARRRRLAAVKALAQRYEGDAPQQAGARRSHVQAQGGGAVRQAAVQRHEKVDSAVKKTEQIEIVKLKAEVKKMREQARLRKLKEQVAKLRHQVLSNEQEEQDHEQGEGEEHEEEETEGEHGEEGEGEEQEGEEGEEGHEEGEEGEEGEGENPCESEECKGECDKKCAEKLRKLFAPRRVKVCNSMGCTWKVVPAAKPPHPLSPSEWEKSAFTGDDKDFLQMMLPGADLEPEVHLNKEGEIRADHDDPNGKLMPHDKYQEAEYPDGEKHERSDDGTAPGITNSVGVGLFADNIVPAAPGFNAGMGRHVRAQEAADYSRNWETQRESKKGRDEEGKPWIVG